MRTTSWSATICVLLATACTGSREGDVFPESGPQGDAPLWTVTDAGTLGETTLGGGGHPFGSIVDIAVDTNGNVYVVDGQAGTVEIFDRAGAWKMSLGGFGEAPGEFRSITDIVCTSSRLWVVEGTWGRLTEYRFDGTLVRTHPWEARLRPGLYWGEVDGTLLGWFPTPPQVGAVMRDSTYGAVVAVARDSVVTWDTLTVIGASSSEVDGVREVLGQVPVQPEFFPIPLIGTMGDTWAWSMTSEMSFRVMDSQGEGLGRLSRPTEPAPVTDEIKATVAERYRRQLRRIRMSEDRIDEQVANLQFWRTVPVLQRTFEGPGATLWAMRSWNALGSVRDDNTALSTLWDVFGKDRGYLGAMPLPASFSPRATRGDEILGVQMGELGLPYVRVLRLSRP